jgi:hypothetical protein
MASSTAIDGNDCWCCWLKTCSTPNFVLPGACSPDADAQAVLVLWQLPLIVVEVEGFIRIG